METVIEQIKDQYNRYPYPAMSWLATVTKEAAAHATYEVGAALVHKRPIPHEGKSIALLGCGTFEPYAMAKAHPQARISAVDLSGQSLRKAKLRCTLRFIKNIDFYEEDLISFCHRNSNSFDYIYCSGVIHHLEDPLRGLSAIKRSLKPDGFARLMIYSKVGRRRLELLHQFFKLLGLNDLSSKDIRRARELMKVLPEAHPLKLTYLLNSDHENVNGLVDSVLNRHQQSFVLAELQTLLKQAGLNIQQWDFSQNLINLLKEARGENIEEKIQWLQAFDQWPSNFTFWAAGKESSPVKKSYIVKNPYISSDLRGVVPSTCLHRHLIPNKFHRSILKSCAEMPQPKDSFISDPQLVEALTELTQSRFVMEVEG